MTDDTLFVFALLALTILLFASNRIRVDIVALLIITAFTLSDVLTLQEAVAGFGNSTVILIAVLFVIGDGLVRTGVAMSVGNWLMRVSGNSQTRLLILLMGSVAILGAFMSSTGVVAIFIPVILGICAKTANSPSKLMMPMAYAALVSGMLTLIATPPNLVVNDELRREGLETFAFFDFTPIGLVVLALTMGYILLAGRWLLPTDRDAGQPARKQLSIRELWGDYGLEGRGHRLMLPRGSPLAGLTVAEAQLRSRYGAAIIGIERRNHFGESLHPALADTELREGDAIYILVDKGAEEADRLVREQGLRVLSLSGKRVENVAQSFGLAELLLPPDSELIGVNLKKAAFRTRHGLNALAVKRKGEVLAEALVETRLAVGDILLVSGGWRQIRKLMSDPEDFVILTVPAEAKEAAPARDRAPFALLSLLGMILLMTLDLVPNLTAALLAALAMGLFGCVSAKSAYKSINWESLILIAGMLPFATALQKSGGIDLVVDGLMVLLGDAGPIGMMAGLFVLTAVLGLFVSNTATAVLMAPIAIATAHEMAVSPYPFALTVILAASAAFATPISSPVNTLVWGPGKYSFGDYVKLGVPLILLVMLISLFLVPVLFPLQPVG
ncbi:MAG: SLC13 family permease [Chromatiaceae bacterium]|jgi:di/tricarboxylate transporter|nr:SLC13 family permease [Chromatiaceae bacterium]